jgi:transcription initiation factor TFIIIB Brf1 subunit/transcription initiation factor TFIIB
MCIYRKAHERELERGRYTASALAAALYCRQEGTPRTLKEICMISNMYNNSIILLLLRLITTGLYKLQF